MLAYCWKSLCTHWNVYCLKYSGMIFKGYLKLVIELSNQKWLFASMEIGLLRFCILIQFWWIIYFLKKLSIWFKVLNLHTKNCAKYLLIMFLFSLTLSLDLILILCICIFFLLLNDLSLKFIWYRLFPAKDLFNLFAVSAVFTHF